MHSVRQHRPCAAGYLSTRYATRARANRAASCRRPEEHHPESWPSTETQTCKFVAAKQHAARLSAAKRPDQAVGGGDRVRGGPRAHSLHRNAHRHHRPMAGTWFAVARLTMACCGTAPGALRCARPRSAPPYASPPPRRTPSRVAPAAPVRLQTRLKPKTRNATPAQSSSPPVTRRSKTHRTDVCTTCTTLGTLVLSKDAG